MNRNPYSLVVNFGHKSGTSDTFALQIKPIRFEAYKVRPLLCRTTTQQRSKLVSSSTKENQSSQQYSASLSNLETLKPRVHFGTTLFIEAEKPKKLNRNFLAKLTNGYSNETL